MNSKLIAAVTVACLGISLGATANAAPKSKPKPIKKTYTATAVTPDPTPVTSQTGGNCHPTLDSAKHEEPFTVPYPGTLTVDINGFQGDWAGALIDTDGASITDNDQDATAPIDTPVHMDARFKKKGEKVLIRACNFAGGPTATVTYVFTAK